MMSKWFSQGLGSGRLEPFYLRSEQTHVVPHEVTITTLVTLNRLPVLQRLAEHYQGPISAVLHIDDNEQQDRLLEETRQMYLDHPAMRRHVDIHVLVDKYERQFNLWRNLAKMYARTDYILMLDVDFLVSPSIRQILPTLAPNLIDALRLGKAALVIPAFEEKQKTTNNNNKTDLFPTSKKELIHQVKQHKVDMFHSFWLKGHGATNYTHWYTATAPYKVVDYNYAYEPYVIIKKEDTAWCDERFIGYGANKAACHFELYISGVDYFVLPDEYLLHQYHPYPENTRSYERQLNRKLYDHFREEICFRYARSMMARGQWDTEQADNAKRECRKIKHWKDLMENVQ
ncbi:glycosyl-transferase for dystroglycan-domain-containing protein [Halteromyces radiatus]|uniref:glycosyl-transferase for dystroglycan-domain-containing protein n=1 Tax=Halteromyces radiatus TaxID=101107 RepID=UPI00221F6093|nr:glycosyl-transferase for dystroglycan-domain-containing protein [Halteromyces radiatus]KAI8078812.1 glycosyl-transferase for dystroglycan-domain-containing protein [Halteromyces radiatus]